MAPSPSPPPRCPIHGEVTLDEAKALTEEGVGISLQPWSRQLQN
ncbi:hypothetical protein [Rhodospirillum sp. A1_3_36]